MGEFTVTGLRVVREAARTGSFSGAAERLGYTQSAVSRQVTLMEQAAGRPLFERWARGVRPTEAGRVVLRHADSVLDTLDTARGELRDLGSRSPALLRLGAFSTATAYLVPHAISVAVQRFPELRQRLREGTSPALLSALGRGRIDLAVISGRLELPEGVETSILLEDWLYVAVPRGHPLSGSVSVPPARLHSERWITGSEDPATTLLGTWTDPARRPTVAYVARDWVAKLGLVAAGLGVTVVPGLMVPALPHTVSVIRIDHPDATRPTFLAARTDSAALRHPMAESLRDAAAHLAHEIRGSLRDNHS
ncbi:LysR family transcriptional regulator [Nocardia sp. BMG111209]|uniref:LysR family transcriptional regulator n=1 Tax=Nocardia sp. BMG111209 TaxID=1160137 RepID=UPI00037CD7A3|nr:LysR family transcriptional regulator [Nocardia sp. BMG111209]